MGSSISKLSRTSYYRTLLKTVLENHLFFPPHICNKKTDDYSPSRTGHINPYPTNENMSATLQNEPKCLSFSWNDVFHRDPGVNWVIIIYLGGQRTGWSKVSVQIMSAQISLVRAMLISPSTLRSKSGILWTSVPSWKGAFCFENGGKYIALSQILALHFWLLCLYTVEEDEIWLRITCKWLITGLASLMEALARKVWLA